MCQLGSQSVAMFDELTREIEELTGRMEKSGGEKAIDMEYWILLTLEPMVRCVT